MVQFPTGGIARERFVVFSQTAESGEIPAPTVTVRTEENGGSAPLLVL
jgi:hypothetical protein